jgi:hypothetical protein
MVLPISSAEAPISYGIVAPKYKFFAALVLLVYNLPLCWNSRQIDSGGGHAVI